MAASISGKYLIVDVPFTSLGSKYKFRIMAASISGISEASPESEEIMIGEFILIY